MGNDQKNDRSKKLRRKQIWLIALFVAVLVGLGAVSVFDTDPTVSEREKREPKKYPAFSLEALFNGTFFSDVEEAYNDTFPFRDFFIDAKSAVDNLLTLRAGGDVMIKLDDSGEDNTSGGDDWDDTAELDEDDLPDEDDPFEAPSDGNEDDPHETPSGGNEDDPHETPSGGNEDDPHETPSGGNEDDPHEEKKPVEIVPFDGTGYEQFASGRTFSGVLVKDDRGMELFNGTLTGAEAFSETMQRLCALFDKSNVVAFVAPNATAFYAGAEYNSDNHDQRAWLEMMRKNLPGAVMPNLYDALREHTDEYIYFRTDHHWTTLGAYYGYRALAQELGLQAVSKDTLRHGALDGAFLGSHYSRTNVAQLAEHPDTVEYWLPSVKTKAVAHTNRKNLSSSKSIKVINETYHSSSNLYKCFTAGDNPLTVITTSAKTGRTCVILKNSYGNSLVPWLCHHYDTLYYIDPRHVNTTENNTLLLQEYFSDVHIDDVIVCCDITMLQSTSNIYFAGLLRLLG